MNKDIIKKIEELIDDCEQNTSTVFESPWSNVEYNYSIDTLSKSVKLLTEAVKLIVEDYKNIDDKQN